MSSRRAVPLSHTHTRQSVMMSQKDGGVVCSDEDVCGQVTTREATEVLEMFHMFRRK